MTYTFEYVRDQTDMDLVVVERNPTSYDRAVQHTLVEISTVSNLIRPERYPYLCSLRTRTRATGGVRTKRSGCGADRKRR